MASLEQTIKSIVKATPYSLAFLSPVFAYQGVDAQSNDINFKVKELTNGTGADIANTRIIITDETNNTQFIGFSDSNGQTTINQVPYGNYTINMSKDENFLQLTQKNYVLNTNQTFNASIPKKIRTGPWGTDTLKVDWYNAVFQSIGTTGLNSDPSKWDHIKPIYNKLAPGTPQTDSLLVVTAITDLKNKTGYDLIKLVPNASADTSYVIYMNSAAAASFISTDANRTILNGWSKITPTTATKKIIHEITQQFDMYPLNDPALYPSVMDQNISTMTDPQKWDYDHIALTFDQHTAKARGEQDFFLGNLLEFVPKTLPSSTNNILPANNSIGLPSAVENKWNPIANADNYRLQISKNSSFTDLIIDKAVYRNDTTITLPEGTQCYERIRVINSIGNSSWSIPITFTTKKVVMPGNTTVTNPTNNSSEVPTPNTSLECTTATNALQYEFQAKNDKNVIVLDTLVDKTQVETNRFQGNRTYKITARAKNMDGYGQWSSTNTFKTYDNAPEITAKRPISTDTINPEYETQFTWDANDKDNDKLLFSLHLWNNNQDTTIYDIIEQNYNLKKGFIKNNQTYSYNITASDGTKETTSNTEAFNTTTGIDNIVNNSSTKSQLQTYPNPVRNQLNIKSNYDRPVTLDIELYSIDGKLIENYHENMYGNSEDKIDLSKIKTGEYILTTKIHTNNNKILIDNKKIIKIE